jgi:hypothetical protein
VSGLWVRLHALAVVFCVIAWPQSSGVVARAAGVTGPATLMSPGAAALVLTPGYILSPGDRIDTRAGGRVVIDLSDGSMVVVSPGSLVTLKDYRAATSLRELFEITLGMVRVKINHFAGKPNPYRMNSPTASIAVRGTEFTIEVDSSGTTQVTVIEGAVEVSSLSDPARSVVLQAGETFRLLAGNFGLPANRGDDRRGDPPPPPNKNLAQARGPDGHADGQPPTNAPQGLPAQPPQPVQPGKAGMPPRREHEVEEISARASASTYGRYLSALADIRQAPFLLRFNAFAEDHLDSLENPAYATVFQSAEGRVFFLPTIHGTPTLEENQSTFGPGGSRPGDYSISPQVSFFAPASGFTFGGSASFSQLGNSLTAPSTGSSPSTFYSGSAVVARRLGSNSFGLELSTLRGSGSLSSITATEREGPGPSLTEQLASTSDVTQTRLTLGYARDLSGSAKLGVYYRYALIAAGDRDTLHTIGALPAGLDSTGTAGHSSEFGLRLRGALTSRLSYGLAGSWLGVSLVDGLVRAEAVNSHERDRAHRSAVAAGLGYSLTRRTILTFDFAGGATNNSAARTEDATLRLLQNSGASNRFVSVHTAVRQDVTRRLFLNASFLQVWRSGGLKVSLFPDRFGYVTNVSDPFFPLTTTANFATRFGDFGAGWRFGRDLLVEYIYSTDYGMSVATHTLMLRYTLRKGR